MGQFAPQSRAAAPPVAAFTLVELLVVIGIIAVLAGILFPAFARVRAKSYESVCISNMRQIGHAFRMYEQDYSDTPRSIQWLCDTRYITDTRILHCPADPDENRGGVFVGHQYALPRVAETVRYSYLSLWSSNHSTTSTVAWPGLLANESVAGLLACQVHGEPRQRTPGSLPFLLDYEGLILRLQFDGAVVRRHVRWAHYRLFTEADPWLLFCECDWPGPPPLTATRRIKQ